MSQDVGGVGRGDGQGAFSRFRLQCVQELADVARPHQPAARRVLHLGVRIGQVFGLAAEVLAARGAHGLLNGRIGHVIGADLGFDHVLPCGGVIEGHGSA